MAEKTTIKDLKPYFDEARSDKITFVGKCHDCGKDISIEIDRLEDGYKVSGGAVYMSAIGPIGKCDVCYKELPALHNFQPCAVYSRIVGYMRPVSDWNPGKQAEFKIRKVFEL